MDYIISMEMKGNSPEEFVEDVYLNIKGALTHNPQVITVENVEALAEQLTELAARKKEEGCGE